MPLSTAQKKQIVHAAKAYMAEHSLNASRFSEYAQINETYISQILAGKETVRVGQKDTPILDRWFTRMADAVGYVLARQYWGTVQTVQFSEIIAELEVCKRTSKMGFICAETGAGKTFAIEVFQRKNPLYTYRITASALFNVGDMASELCEALGIETTILTKRSQGDTLTIKRRIDRVAAKLKNIQETGGHPIIIIDEGENMKRPVMRMIKAMYDALLGYASIVLIGTEQLEAKVVRLKYRNTEGIPQLWRRFKAHRKSLTAISPAAFQPFFDRFIPKDKGLQRLLKDIADNYGELHDYLEPALREADTQGKPLTEDFFRIMYNMPATAKTR